MSQAALWHRPTRVSAALVIAWCCCIGRPVRAQEALVEAQDAGTSSEHPSESDGGLPEEPAGDAAVLEPAEVVGSSPDVPAEPPTQGIAEPAPSAEPSPEDAAGFAAPTLTSDDEAGFGVASSIEGPVAGAASGDCATSDSAAPSPWSLTGALRSRNAVSTRAEALQRVARLRQGLDLRLAGAGKLGVGTLRLVASVHGEYDFSQLIQADEIARSSRDVYRQQLIFQENYLSYQLAGVVFAVGRQIVNWGQSEVLNLLDVINPRDLREPGLADLSDLRMAVLATRVEVSSGDQRFEVVIVHEPYFGLRAQPLGTFSPLRSLLLDNPAFASSLGTRDLVWSHRPGHDVTEYQATQPHGRWSYSGRGYDLTLQAGSVLDAIGIATLPEPTALAHQRVALPLYHPRYEVVGHSGAATWGAFLLRWEASAELDRPLQTRRTATPFLEFGAVRRTQLNALVGATYLGSRGQTASLELMRAYVVDNPERQRRSDYDLLLPVEATQLAFRSQQAWFEDRLSLSLLGVVVGIVDFNSLAARIELGYAPRDGLKMLLGYMGYHSTRAFGPFYGFARNEQVYLGARWDFTAQ